MHNVSLITTVAASFGIALIMGLLANKLRLPALVGYLFAGMVIGPGTPGFVADLGLSAELAEIGVILLMFGVGLHFSLEDLLEVKRIAVPGSIIRMVVATAMGAGLAAAWGWGLGACLVFGLALAVASTVVLIKALEQRNMLRTMNGQIAVGWLIVEDLATVLVLVLLPPLSEWLGGHPVSDMMGASHSLGWSLSIALVKISLFIAFMLLVGRRVFPWLLGYVAETGSRELFSLSVIAAAVGIAYGSAKLFGVSFALGAFFAGMLMRESHLSHRAAQESLPLRDAFSVLFFVSVGMLFDPSVLIHQPLRVLAVVAIIVFGKSLVSFVLVLAFRYPLNTALTVSAGLAQIGEFSFILTGLGMSLGLLPHEGQSLVLAGAIISISLNQFVFKAIQPAEKWIRGRSSLARKLEQSVDPLAELPTTVSSSYVTDHIIIVGYGRVGSRIGLALAEKNLHFVVAEQNREMVEKLRKTGLHAVAGDSADPVVLIQAHIVRARVLVIAIPDTLKALKMIETARLLNPDVVILARTHSEEEAALFRKENVNMVFMGEHELALNMTHHLLQKLQLDERR
jgi:CPA2 family monovalent cation:H+ antiporter-2